MILPGKGRLVGYTLLAAFVVCICAGCDLFSNMPENDLEKKLDDQIAYTLAAPANLRIGSIPGSVNTIPPFLAGQKQGYPFTVYFTANPAWAFTGWEAVLSSDFTAYLNGDRQERLSIAGKAMPYVKLEETTDTYGNKTGDATVTVYSGADLTLVPHCVERLKVTSSNLPGNFTDRKVTNYPIQIWFSREIDPACLNFDNFIISAETNQGYGGRILEGAAFTEKYFAPPAVNGKQIVIARKPGTLSEPEFINLNITVKLNSGGIYDSIDKISMGEPGQYEELYYGVAFKAYTTPPVTERLEAETGATGSTTSLFPGKADFSGDAMILTEKKYYVATEENDERVVYLLFDQKELDESIVLVYTSLDHVRITEKREEETNQSEDQYPFAMYGFSTADAGIRFRQLAEEYKNEAGNAEPYIVRHVLKTRTDGIIQLAVQPTDTLGNYDSFEQAKKVRVILDTTPPGPVNNVSADYNPGAKTLELQWKNPGDPDLDGILLTWGIMGANQTELQLPATE